MIGLGNTYSLGLRLGLGGSLGGGVGLWLGGGSLLGGSGLLDLCCGSLGLNSLCLGNLWLFVLLFLLQNGQHGGDKVHMSETDLRGGGLLLSRLSFLLCELNRAGGT